MTDEIGETSRGRERLACPACEDPGGSPRGLLSWVCENPDCPVETFRVIDHEEPDAEEDTTNQELVTDGGRDEGQDETPRPVKNAEWIAGMLEEVPVVNWDRFVVEDHDGTQCVRVYGWIERDEDEYKDFVIVRFWPEYEDFGYTTSSDRYTEYLYHEWVGGDLDGHDPCRRVENAFDVENVIELHEQDTLVTDGGRDESPVEHCPACGQDYRGYHRCAEGTDRVEFTCSDCEEHIDRERHQMDVAGVPPARCASCTMERMAA